VSFKCTGDIGSGSIQLRSHTDVEKPENNVEIDLTEPVSLTFSLKYLVNFCKASGMSDQVKLCLSNEVPLLVEYGLQSNSYLRFYLAPKVRPQSLCYIQRLANWARSVTRSKCFMINYYATSGMISGYTWRFSGGALFMYACSVYQVHTGCYCARLARGCICGIDSRPAAGMRCCSMAGTNPADVTRLAISDNGKKSTIYNHSLHSPLASYLLTPSPPLILATSFLVAAMASDTLIPDTRVLAIASHVRVTRSLLGGL
jgi:hypothetical protein